jgi:hypothetical protein
MKPEICQTNDQMAGQKIEKQLDSQFLQKDYEFRVSYLSTHFTRMWTRFNFFIALESGLSAALWVWLKDASAKTAQVVVDPAIGIACIGLVSGIAWYVFGVQDRYLVEAYRKQVERAGKKLADHFGDESYVYVGAPTDEVKTRIYQWRWEPISVTRLAAWFPLLVTLYRIVMVVCFVKV